MHGRDVGSLCIVVILMTIFVKSFNLLFDCEGSFTNNLNRINRNCPLSVKKSFITFRLKFSLLFFEIFGISFSSVSSRTQL